MPQSAIITLGAMMRHSQKVLVGLDTGDLLEYTPGKHVRNIASARKQGNTLVIINPITSLKQSPFIDHIFAANHDQDFTMIFSVNAGGSSLKIPTGQIDSLVWSPHRPAVILILGTDGILQVWDLLQSTSLPVRTSSVWKKKADDFCVIGRRLLVSTAGKLESRTLDDLWTDVQMDEMAEFLAAITR